MGQLITALECERGAGEGSDLAGVLHRCCGAKEGAIGDGRAWLLAGGLAEGCVDAILPARSVFLEEVEHVAVDAQRHRLSRLDG